MSNRGSAGDPPPRIDSVVAGPGPFSRTHGRRHRPQRPMAAPLSERLLASEGSFDMLRNDPLAARLRRAIVREELTLHFQPLVDATTMRLIGTEALLRWHAPEIGPIPPASLIPLAEQSGLIHALTLEVLNQALRQGQQWHRTSRPLRISVNLSPVCLQDPKFPQRVAALLKAWAMPPECLELELTESEILEDLNHAARMLQALRDMGIRIGLDSFGHGHSTLRRLRALPIDSLKIDGSYVRGFVTNPVDRAIAEALRTMAHALGCQAIATGVESAETLEKLVEAGFDTLQGHWIGHPVPADVFTQRWLSQGPTSR